MFSKFKSGGGGQSPLETNPIGQFFEIGKQTASAGPELLWKIHDAYRKSDGKVCHQIYIVLLVLPSNKHTWMPLIDCVRYLPHTASIKVRFSN